jgi:hypothetical protein
MVHRAHDRQLIDVPGQAGQMFADADAGHGGGGLNSPRYSTGASGLVSQVS